MCSCAPPLCDVFNAMCNLLCFAWHGPAPYVRQVRRYKSPTPACWCLEQQTCRRCSRRRVMLAVLLHLPTSPRTASPVDVSLLHSTLPCQQLKTSYRPTNCGENIHSTIRSRKASLANARFASFYVKLPESTAVRTKRGLWLIDSNTCMLETWK